MTDLPKEPARAARDGAGPRPRRGRPLDLVRRPDHEMAVAAWPTAPGSRRSSCSTRTGPPPASPARPAAPWACSFCATGQAGFARQLSVGRDRRTGGQGQPGGAAPPPLQRGLHGHGRTLGQLRPDLGGRRAASTPTSAFPPATSPSRPWASSPASGGWPPRPCPSTWPSPCTPRATSSAAAIVPLNRRYPLSVLMGACAEYLAAKEPAAVV